jgi:L-iditol 2-dehydrogenase
LRRYELVDRRRVELRTGIAVPRPGPGEVLVRVGACTLCGRSDLVYYHWLGLRAHCAQGCFGHEIAGTVEEVGPGVRRVAPGDRVFVRTPLSSGYADFALARELAVGHLPEDIPFEQGAILQLLPLAVHATRGVGLGDRVLIVGQGPVGLMALQLAKLRGAAAVTVVDLDPWRLERAAQLGADRTLAAPPGATERELAELLAAGGPGVRGSSGGSSGPGGSVAGGGFDVAIEAVGTPATARGCVDAVRVNGLVVFLGTHHVDTSVSFDMVQWEKKGLRVHTAAEATDEARAAAMAVAERLAAHGRIRLAELHTHTYPLTELPRALEQLSQSPLLHPADAPGPYAGPPPRTLKIAVCP